MIDKVKNFKQFVNEQVSNEYHNIGDTINISDIDYDIMSYFDRTNRKLLVTMNNGEEFETSVGKFYNDLVFHGKFPSNLDKKDISFIKIIG
jgi:hypothetical protein